METAGSWRAVSSRDNSAPWKIERSRVCIQRSALSRHKWVCELKPFPGEIQPPQCSQTEYMSIKMMLSIMEHVGQRVDTQVTHNNPESSPYIWFYNVTECWWYETKWSLLGTQEVSFRASDMVLWSWWQRKYVWPKIETKYGKHPRRGPRWARSEVPTSKSTVYRYHTFNCSFALPLLLSTSYKSGAIHEICLYPWVKFPSGQWSVQFTRSRPVSWTRLCKTSSQEP